VKGGFTELDRTIASAALGVGFRLALGRIGAELSLDGDETWNVVTLDIQLAEPDGRQLSGIATALSVLVNSKTLDGFLLMEDDKGTVAASAAGKMKAVGRFHASQRLLIYAGLYWLFSHYFAIDGKACVDGPQADVAILQQLVQTYRQMSEQERIKVIQRLLQEQGFPLEADGLLGPVTRRAIRFYQASQGEIITGQLSAHLYLKLHRTTAPQVSKEKQRS
jgi:Putative peptidoglycan binding domain